MRLFKILVIWGFMNETHFEVGKKVRKTIKDLGGTMPEKLPFVQHI